MTEPRTIILNNFYKYLSEYEEWKELLDDKKNQIARRLERSCFNKTNDICTEKGIYRNFNNQQYIEHYSAECKRIFENIDINGPVGSKYLGIKLIKGEIQPSNITNMTHYEMCPEVSEDLRNLIEKRVNQKVERKKSKLHKCKCGSNEIEVREAQTRALDEAAVLKITCLVCNNHWTD